MDFLSLIDPKPTTLTILPTHKCTASCHQCCFGCTPQIEHTMPYEEVVYHIDKALENFPSLIVLVLTGGECFTLGENLDKIVRHASNKGLKTRVVTNAYWANTYDNAYERLFSLKDNGLCEFNVSTGDNHQKFVPFDNVVNAVVSAINVGITPVLIALESHDEANFTEQDIKQHPSLSELCADDKVKITNGVWIKFREGKGVELKNHDYARRCTSLFNTIVVNPYSQLLACCGLIVEHNEYLKLGNALTNPIKKLYESQFDDIFKIWLYTHGPKYIYDTVQQIRGKEAQRFAHICLYCAKIVQDEENIRILQKIIASKIPDILYRLSLINRKIVN